MKKHIVLCADDYGQEPVISQGILALLKRQRLSAVSCMVSASYWHEHATLLAPYQKQVDIGLHFNLTEGKTALPVVLLQALLRRLDVATISAELNRQLDLFISEMGCLPDFIDGHQHVHQFPVVRDALLRVYETRFKDHKPYIRLINSKLKIGDMINDVKKIIVQTMGTRALRSALIQYDIPFNSSFSGMYSFSTTQPYSRIFPTFLKEIDDRGLIMCHPGLGSSTTDPIVKARNNEYEYFVSSQFSEDCLAYGVTIERFKHS